MQQGFEMITFGNTHLWALACSLESGRNFWYSIVCFTSLAFAPSLEQIREDGVTVILLPTATFHTANWRAHTYSTYTSGSIEVSRNALEPT